MKYLSIFSLFLLSFTFLPAQNETSNSIWVQAGLGFVSANFPDSDGGLNGNASLNYRTDYGIFSFNYFPILGEEYINTYSLQYGRSYDFKMRGLIFPLPIFLLIKKKFNYSLITRAGISYNIWNKRGEVKETFFIFDKYNYELKKGIGFPLEVELKQDITSYLGMGIGFYANFSPVKGYSGASLNLYIGSF
ncbi:MAG: hypothetical protein GXX85_04295 [Ignavibacteria bacterium]|nr:hypothetical protein [Ignavibacteria bacterium]